MQKKNANPGGLGPWWCQLLFCVSNVPKKQTHLCSHTYPHLYEKVMNKTMITSSDRKRARDTGWATMQVVGPFEKWKHAVVFQKLWSEHTRGKLRRLQQGVKLLSLFHEKYQLFMELPTKTRDSIIQDRKKRRKGNYFSSIDSEKLSIPTWSSYQNDEQQQQQQQQQQQHYNNHYRSSSSFSSSSSSYSIKMAVHNNNNNSGGGGGCGSELPLKELERTLKETYKGNFNIEMVERLQTKRKKTQKRK